eukprot:687572-Amphidinium_carterae.1
MPITGRHHMVGHGVRAAPFLQRLFRRVWGDMLVHSPLHLVSATSPKTVTSSNSSKCNLIDQNN